MDAVRISDNTLVLIKMVMENHDKEEIPVGRLFSSEPHASNPRNHCIPLYDVMEIPNTNPLRLALVIPFMRKFDDPQFTTVSEAVDFFAQIIEVIKLSRFLRSRY